MGGDAAHCVHRDRASGGLFVAAAVGIRPRDIQRDLLFKCGVSQFAGDAADRRGWHPGFEFGALRCVFNTKEASGQQLK
jgi:hypothetical protein